MQAGVYSVRFLICIDSLCAERTPTVIMAFCQKDAAIANIATRVQ